jgi:DNA-binding PadR family transcriptional regulator
MYPTLHSLAKGGYLDSEKRTVDGKMRRYYHITPKGREMMEEARSKINELVKEVVE